MIIAIAAVAALVLIFVTHASFFSIETGQAVHRLRPAVLADVGDMPLFNAYGVALGFTL